MPDGIYLSTDTLQKLHGDLFEQDARGPIADAFEQQATAALPDMVAQAQQQQAAAEQAKRDAAADAFQKQASAMLSDPDLTQHLGGGGATVPDSTNPGVSVVPPAMDSTPTDVQPSVAPSPAAPAPYVAPPPPPADLTPPQGFASGSQQPLKPPAPVTQTTAALSGGGDAAGQIGPRGQQIMAQAATDASWLGDQGVKALQAVLLTEGGLAGARGDHGQSAGPLQFYTGGQLANFAQQHGMTQADAMTYVEQHPEEAIQWAIGTPDAPGYLGRAILQGQQAGLQGAALATYAQQHGQVSVSPERAGQNYDALFGGGQTPISGAVQAVQSAVQDPQSIIQKVAPFLGQPYVWGGKGPQQGFDCSGLAGYLTTGQPESTTTLYGKSAGVSPDQAQPGDLVFWNMGSSDPHMQHVAVYLGNGQIVQSGGNQSAVNIGSVNQQIGSPPEFRRVGDGGAPAQAQQAPPNAPDPATPPQQSASPLDSFKQKIGDAFSDLLAPLQNLLGGNNATPAPEGGGYGAAPAGGSALPALGDAASQVGGAILAAGQNPAQNGPIGAFNAGLQGIGQAVADSPVGQAYQSDIRQQMFPNITEPNHPLNIPSTLAAKYGTDPLTLTAHPEMMTPDDQAALANSTLAVGGMAGNVGGAGALIPKTGNAILQDALSKLGQYPEDAAQGIRQTIADAQQAGTPASTIGAQVQRWMSQNPIEQFSTAPTLGHDVASTLPPGSGPLAEPLPPMESTDALQGLLQMAKARGVDTSGFEAKVRELAPKVEPEPVTVGAGGSSPRPPVVDTAPPATPPPPPPGSLPAEVGAVPPSTPTGGANAWDYLRALRTGSLAGGLQTVSHILLNAPIQAAFKIMSDAPLTLIHPETIPLEFVGVWQGLRGWAMNSALAPLGQPGKIAQSIGGPAGTAVETGLLGLVKTHPILQNASGQIGTGMELWRQAGIEASNAGLQRFSGQWWTEVQNLVANPTTKMIQAAEQTGNDFALRGSKGQFGQAVSGLLNSDWGNKWGRFIEPMFDIGYKVATKGIEFSPLGLLGTGADTAALAIGKGPYAGGAVAQGVTPLAQRFRNNMVGVGLGVEAYHQASLGNITGNGPDDPRLRKELMDTGWQPDSYRVGDRYFPLHTLGIAGWGLGEAANLYEATHTADQAGKEMGIGPLTWTATQGGYAKPNATPQEQFLNYLGRMAQYGENETFLRGVAQLLQAAGNAKDFGRLGEQEAASVLGSLIPQGALLSNVASTADQFQRRPAPGDIGQAIENRLPWTRQDLPLKLTPTGQPEPNASAGLGILLPRSSIANNDPVITAMGQAGVGAPTIPKTVSVNSKYQVDLTPAEQQQFQELHGQALNDLLKDVVTDPSWQSVPVARQRDIIQRAMVKATDVARRELLTALPDDQLTQRVVSKADAQAGNRVTLFGSPSSP